MPKRKEFKGNKFLSFISSMRITVVGLLLLFILTFWGTVAQVNNGLYASQDRYFSSFYFLAMGFIPFPGAQLVLWVLGVNLFCAFFSRVIYSWENCGLIIVHYGLVIFLLAAFVTFHSARESHLILKEGESSNVSLAYSDWEIAVWPDSGKTKSVTASDFSALRQDSTLQLIDPELNLKVVSLYKNSQAAFAPFAGIKEKYLNVSNFNYLQALSVDKAPEKNTPGIILQVLNSPDKKLILLHGSDDKPTRIDVNGKPYDMILRLKRFPLPITVKLIEFYMDKHPGTEIARSFKSKVEVDHDGINRETVISMNEPFRFKDYTFYQASYQIDDMGRKTSILAVVKNAGRLLPYIATFVTFLGLALHFLSAAFKFQRGRK